MKTLRILVISVLAILHGLAFAEDRIKLDQTTVIDNHELPKITYIVPWQAAQLPDEEKPHLNGLIKDALEPLDRDILRSQIQFYYATQSGHKVNTKPAKDPSK